MLVGAFQVGTNDQFKQFYGKHLPQGSGGIEEYRKMTADMSIKYQNMKKTNYYLVNSIEYN
jgi:hypothetical protein